MEDLLINNIDCFWSFFFFFFLPQGYNELCKAFKTDNNPVTKYYYYKLQKENKYLNQQGIIGEWFVAQKLYGLPSEYCVFNDVKLSDDEITSQIDHLVLSKYGLFTIETKHWLGTIYGFVTSDCFERKRNGRRSKTFPNPIKQNDAHIIELYKRIGIPTDENENLVTFANKTEGVKCIDKGKVKNVLYDCNIIEHIQSHDKIVLTDEQVMIYGKRIVELFRVGLNLSDINNYSSQSPVN